MKNFSLAGVFIDRLGTFLFVLFLTTFLTSFSKTQDPLTKHTAMSSAIGSKNVKNLDENLSEIPRLVTVPGFDGVQQVAEDSKHYPEIKTSIALSVFRKEWKKIIGDADFVDAAYKDLTIAWLDREIYYDGYSNEGKIFKGRNLRGATMSPNIIYIFQSKKGPDRHVRVCESALAHELVHVVLWNQNGHGDPDHLGDAYDGWTTKHGMLIRRTNEVLCELNI